MSSKRDRHLSAHPPSFPLSDPARKDVLRWAESYRRRPSHPLVLPNQSVALPADLARAVLLSDLMGRLLDCGSWQKVGTHLVFIAWMARSASAIAASDLRLKNVCRTFRVPPVWGHFMADELASFSHSDDPFSSIREAIRLGEEEMEKSAQAAKLLKEQKEPEVARREAMGLAIMAWTDGLIGALKDNKDNLPPAEMAVGRRLLMVGMGMTDGIGVKTQEERNAMLDDPGEYVRRIHAFQEMHRLLVRNGVCVKPLGDPPAWTDEHRDLLTALEVLTT